MAVCLCQILFDQQKQLEVQLWKVPILGANLGLMGAAGKRIYIISRSQQEEKSAQLASKVEEFGANWFWRICKVGRKEEKIKLTSKNSIGQLLKTRP